MGNTIKTSMRGRLVRLKVGEQDTFDVAKVESLRSLASRIGLIYDRTYALSVDREQRTVVATRTR